MSDLRIARVMRWTYDEVQDLPPDVYRVLVQELQREADEEKTRAEERERERKRNQIRT